MSLKRGKSTSAFTIDSLISKSNCHQEKRKADWNSGSQSNHSNHGITASRFSERIEIHAIPDTSNSSTFPTSLSMHGSQMLNATPFPPSTSCPYGGVFSRGGIDPTSHFVPLTTASSFHVPVSPISMTSATTDHLLVPSPFGNPLCGWLSNASGFPRPFDLTGIGYLSECLH